jgi:hypothetical protein
MIEKLQKYKTKKHLLLTLVLTIAIKPIMSQTWNGAVKIELGSEERVFEYVKDSCAVLDLPDVYAHPIRTPEGIVLVSGNAPDNYFMFGQDFKTLSRSCEPVFVSGDQWPVEDFDHQEWITSVYSEDGITIHALVHNEYHDPYSRKCKPGITDPSNPCWYNFITYAISTDGGRTFTQPESPNHLVAILPYKWNPDATPRGAPPPHGYFEPSNIIKYNGYYYCMMFGLISNTDMSQNGTCIMRTDDISKPGSWKIWNGIGFDIPLINPYSNPPQDSSEYFPAFVSHRTIRDLRGSLTRNSYLDKFMLIGSGVHPVNGVETCGFFFSLSDDLLQWTSPQLIRETILGWNPCKNQTPEQMAQHIVQEAYPSLIDHDATDISFTEVDSTAYLYFMQNKDNWKQGGWGLRRDLIRIPITFIKDNSNSSIDKEIQKAPLMVDNYPNPFSGSTTIRWQSTVSGPTSVIVSDVVGRNIITLFDGHKHHGEHTVIFDSEPFPAGTYFYQLKVGDQLTTKKMMLIK